MILAAYGSGKGEVVEIGSFLGRSTCWLATGAKKAKREKVTAVDHFRGSPEHQRGGTHECPVIVQEGSTLPQFLAHLKAAQVDEWVEPLVATSEDAAKGWRKPIRLLFIDGDHSYEASKQDFELWSPFVLAGGYIAFHDIGVWPGVTRFYQELLEATRGFQQIIAAVSLRVVQRIG